MADEIQDYQRKLNNHVERMPPEHLSWHAYFYHLILEDAT